jgi:two-component system chemotaxis response regulator CheY
MYSRSSSCVQYSATSHPTTELLAVAPSLVLEADNYMRRTLVGLLRDAGATTVLTARSASSAMHIIEEQPPSLIIADWSEQVDPAEDRIRFIRRIRNSAETAYQTTPLVLVSAARSGREIGLARDAGVSEFLVKPLAPAILLQRLKSMDNGAREFIQSVRFSGPDRRRNRRKIAKPTFKRTKDVEDGLTTPIRAARASALAIHLETRAAADPLAIRVSQSLSRYLTWVDDYTYVDVEVVEMHRAALAQLTRMSDDGNPLRIPVVRGLEQVVAKRMI